MSNRLHSFTRVTQPIRAFTKTAIFLLNVFPMVPSRLVDRMLKPPVIAN